MPFNRSSLRVEHYRLHAMPLPAAREAMAQIAGVHRACWPEKPMERVYAERLECEAIVENELFLVRASDGQVVGFAHGVSQDIELDGIKVTLLRSIGAAYPEWRAMLGGFERHTAGPMMRVALRARLRGRLPIIFAYFASPATYRTFLRLMPQVVPSPGITPNPGLLRLRDAVIAYFDLQRIPGRAHACIGPTVAMSAGERAHWLEHPDPEIHYFINECPGFGNGEYLAGIVPLDWGNLLMLPYSASVGIVREWIRRREKNGRRSAPDAKAPKHG